jgi:phage tail tape-measure protein
MYYQNLSLKLSGLTRKSMGSQINESMESDPIDLLAGAVAGGEIGAAGPVGIVAGAIIGGIVGEVAIEAIIDALDNRLVALLKNNQLAR